MITPEDKVARLEGFKRLLIKWSQYTNHSPNGPPDLRSQINQDKGWVRQEVIAAHCFKTFTISPPPIIGGLILRGVDPFASMFDPPHDMDLIPSVIDMVDETIGYLKSGKPIEEAESTNAVVDEEVLADYAFVAMPMTEGRPEFDDVLDAIKEGARRCGIQAERVDEPQSSERITDRILESIRRARFVIADFTEARPNVCFEAGYVHALGKIPIYVARSGTNLAFDLKGYPVIFFSNLRDLKDALEKRLRGLGKAKGSG